MSSLSQNDQRKVIWKGAKVTIWAVAYNGEFPASDFINNLEDKDRISLLAIFRLLDTMLMAFRHPQKFKKLLEYDGMTFLEFKCGTVRISCFWQPGFQLYATHGFMKKKDDWPPKEVIKLKNIYTAWKAQKEKND